MSASVKRIINIPNRMENTMILKIRNERIRIRRMGHVKRAKTMAAG